MKETIKAQVTHLGTRMLTVYSATLFGPRGDKYPLPQQQLRTKRAQTDEKKATASWSVHMHSPRLGELDSSSCHAATRSSVQLPSLPSDEVSGHPAFRL